METPAIEHLNQGARPRPRPIAQPAGRPREGVAVSGETNRLKKPEPAKLGSNDESVFIKADWAMAKVLGEKIGAEIPANKITVEAADQIEALYRRAEAEHGPIEDIPETIEEERAA